MRVESFVGMDVAQTCGFRQDGYSLLMKIEERLEKECRPGELK